MSTRGGLGMPTLFGGTQEIAKCTLSLSVKAFLERIDGVVGWDLPFQKREVNMLHIRYKVRLILTNQNNWGEIWNLVVWKCKLCNELPNCLNG